MHTQSIFFKQVISFLSNLLYFYIGQGTAHIGPALTPAEVLIAIHDINPEKDKVALKKVMSFIIVVFSIIDGMLYTINMAPEYPTPLFYERSVEMKATVNFRQSFSFLLWTVHMLLSISG